MIYIVTNKITGQEVYRYEADAPIEWYSVPLSWVKGVYIPLCQYIGGMGLLWRIVKAKKMVFALALDLCLPLVDAVRRLDYTDKSRGVSRPNFLVLHVFSRSCQPQVGYSVVTPIPIDVVNLVNRKTPVVVEPHDSVNLIFSAVNRYLQVPIVVIAANNISNFYTVVVANLSDKFSGVWDIVKKFADSLCGKISLSHAVSPVKKWFGQKPQSVSALLRLRHFSLGVAA